MAGIPFNKPFMTGDEIDFIQKAYSSHHLAGDGQYTKLCQEWLEKSVGCRKALLTHSCTGALEMAALLADVKAGDEVIVPSYTFVSTANAFVLRGAVPVFIDIRPDTLNMDETLIEQAVTPKTKVIVPVHYAGVGCSMDEIVKTAARHDLLVVEDAAQGICASYKGRPLGGLGHMSALSFHETKNVVSGEGGALLINDERFVDRAQVIWQKGTNRQKFLKGMVDKYTWVDVGSSFLPSELTAAFLYAQMKEAQTITRIRLSLWKKYFDAFEDLERAGVAERPKNIPDTEHNAHMFYLLVDPKARDRILPVLKALGIGAHFHYVPLHSSPAGRKFGRVAGSMEVTDRLAASLVRLPMWVSLTEPEQRTVINAIREALVGKKGAKGKTG